MWHFEAIEDIFTKFESKACHIKRIKWQNFLPDGAVIRPPQPPSCDENVALKPFPLMEPSLLNLTNI